ncbi:ribosome assembly cofactor RimP [Brachyspira sp.]|uniref:ribosome assembly cofactor RimP n=1 Tax=Brachyspira sp. TaxID=1977261 RepID=UPI003D7DE599
MKNNKIKPQRKKEYGRGENRNKKKNNLKNKEKINIIDETILFEKSANILEKDNKIYLLNLKVGAIKDNKKVYAVIFKKKESVSHSHCIEATRVIQSVIKSCGFDEGDYTITVSSAGFRWKIEDRFELFEEMPIKIKFKIKEDKIITENGILKEAKEDYIIFENEDNEIIKILKEDIIKTRLNC